MDSLFIAVRRTTRTGDLVRVMCLAVAARQVDSSRSYLVTSYALLSVAAMLRPTYIVAIGIFVMWDVAMVLKKKVG